MPGNVGENTSLDLLGLCPAQAVGSDGFCLAKYLECRTKEGRILSIRIARLVFELPDSLPSPVDHIQEHNPQGSNTIG